MRHDMWNHEFEPARRQRGRGPGRRGGPDSWGGPWGGPLGGPPPWVAQMFGADLAGGPRRGGGRGGRPRVRRGDVRVAILGVLHDAGEPINGYQVIQQIAEKTSGAWKPSPGSVYPTIAQLEDEGLVEDAPTGRKALQLTEEGLAYVAQHATEVDAVWAPFVEQEDDTEAVNFKQVIGQTVGAIVQVVSSGTPDQREKALQILAETRRQMYSLLAEGPEGSLDDDADDDESDGPYDDVAPRER